VRFSETTGRVERLLRTAGNLPIDKGPHGLFDFSFARVDDGQAVGIAWERTTPFRSQRNSEQPIGTVDTSVDVGLPGLHSGSEFFVYFLARYNHPLISEDWPAQEKSIVLGARIQPPSPRYGCVQVHIIKLIVTHFFFFWWMSFFRGAMICDMMNVSPYTITCRATSAQPVPLFHPQLVRGSTPLPLQTLSALSTAFCDSTDQYLVKVGGIVINDQP
jgi:hypothetical protein